MPRTRDQLQAQIDALEDARMRGIRSVTDENGENVTYASDRDMTAALASAKRRLAAPAQPIHTIRFRTSKGL